MYIKRTIEETIISAAESFPCIALYGPRQVGKSTTINKLFGSKYTKVTLDDVDDLRLATSNPKLFLEQYRPPVIIDEIQKAPNLIPEIKKIIDEHRLKWMQSGAKPRSLFVLTGSNKFELQEGISESLAGRCGIIDMSSFTQAEKYGQKASLFTPVITDLIDRERMSHMKHRGRMKMFEDIFEGGMPDVCTGQVDRELYYKSYVNTYVERDVRKLINATSELQFGNFMSLLALRTGQELHCDSIAQSVGIDVRTCKRWISILEAAGIIYLLQPYMANASKRIIKAPKVYFMDTGLCAYLCKWPSALMLESCAMSGAFFETYVVSEIVKNLQAFNKDPKSSLYYYRDIDKKEIDIVYVMDNKLYPIEIKKGINPVRANKNFNVLNKYKMDIAPGLIIDACDRIRAINENAYYYPVSLLGI